MPTQEESLAKAYARLDRQVSAGKISSQQAKVRKLDARRSIFGSAPAAVVRPSVAPVNSAKNASVKKQPGTFVEQIRVWSCSAKTLDWTSSLHGLLLLPEGVTGDIWANVSIASVSWRGFSSLGLGPNDARFAVGLCRNHDVKTFASARKAIGAQVVSCPLSGEWRSISFRQGDERTIFKDSKVVEYDEPLAAFICGEFSKEDTPGKADFEVRIRYLVSGTFRPAGAF